MSTSDLLSEVEAFLERSGMADSTFGRGAVNDWKFVRDLRGGTRRVWPETAAKVRAFIAAQAQATERAA